MLCIYSPVAPVLGLSDISSSKSEATITASYSLVKHFHTPHAAESFTH